MARNKTNKRARRLKAKERPAVKASRSNRPTSVEKAYARALQLNRETGNPVRFVVGIGPDGAESVTGFEESSAPYAGPRVEAPDLHLERALAAARRRGRLRVAEILAGPEMLSADAFAARLGTTRATVTAWRHKNQVLGLEGATRGFRFPDWQVGPDGKPFRALPELFDRLGGDTWDVYRFLVQHHPELGGMTAREALQKGRVKAVVEAAESVAQSFA